MSGCCSTYGSVASAHFDEKIARRELASYRKKGPGTTTRLLRDLLLETGDVEGVLLDVGSGVGGLTFELLEQGVERAISVDASPANLAAATEEAARRGRTAAVRFVLGDFLDRATEIPAATVVTLDRVVCCYPLYQPLLEEAMRHADRYFALSYPRQIWYVHAAIAFENAMRRIRSNPFRTFVHSVERMTNVIRSADFNLVSRRQTRQWSAELYARQGNQRLPSRGLQAMSHRRRGTPSSASLAATASPCVPGLTCLSTNAIRPSSPMKNVHREANG